MGLVFFKGLAECLAMGLMKGLVKGLAKGLVKGLIKGLVKGLTEEYFLLLLVFLASLFSFTLAGLLF